MINFDQTLYFAENINHRYPCALTKSFTKYFFFQFKNSLATIVNGLTIDMLYDNCDDAGDVDDWCVVAGEQRGGPEAHGTGRVRYQISCNKHIRGLMLIYCRYIHLL